METEELEDVAGGRSGKGGSAWAEVHQYIEEMNAKYGPNTTMEDLSPEERRHLEWLRSKGYEEWRNRY